MKYSHVKPYKYKLEENFVRQTGIIGFEFDTPYYSMLDDGTFLVKRGYAWDGSSVPHKGLLRIASLWIYDPDRYCKPASLIHDGLCQAMREGLLHPIEKIATDVLYMNMCIEGGMGIKQAHNRFRALHKFGDVGIKPEKNPRNRIYDTQKGE
ncbi:unnamed protein product [marine sediment metagenome]|uniref:DUF1353 domain-containing protein n=1 Tax=marine sediment metagenome TaxID=412755 RepID=X0SW30_9ZZZZ